MEVSQAILRRRSERRYTGEPIPEESLRGILQAGLLAPTGHNKKPCEFYLVQNRALLRELSVARQSGAGQLKDCAAAIVVFGDAAKTDTWVEDCSIALSFMQLQATELGIGSCWCQMHLRFDADGRDAEANVRAALKVPESYRVAGILALGIPAEPRPAHTPEEADWSKLHILP